MCVFAHINVGVNISLWVTLHVSVCYRVCVYFRYLALISRRILISAVVRHEMNGFIKPSLWSLYNRDNHIWNDKSVKPPQRARTHVPSREPHGWQSQTTWRDPSHRVCAVNSVKCHWRSQDSKTQQALVKNWYKSTCSSLSQRYKNPLACCQSRLAGANSQNESAPPRILRIW